MAAFLLEDVAEQNSTVFVVGVQTSPLEGFPQTVRLNAGRQTTQHRRYQRQVRPASSLRRSFARHAANTLLPIQNATPPPI